MSWHPERGASDHRGPRLGINVVAAPLGQFGNDVIMVTTTAACALRQIKGCASFPETRSENLGPCNRQPVGDLAGSPEEFVAPRALHLHRRAIARL